jgi:hypothetical protein
MTEDEDEDVDVENDNLDMPVHSSFSNKFSGKTEFDGKIMFDDNFDDKTVPVKVCSGKEEDLVDIERLDGGTDLSDNCEQAEFGHGRLENACTGIDTLGTINYQTFPDIYHENSNHAFSQNTLLDQGLLIDPTFSSTPFTYLTDTQRTEPHCGRPAGQ